MISRGSEWHRWEPHIHGPGTILNNQFGAADPWSAYLTTLEGLTPKIEAIAVADYYVTDTYEEILDACQSAWQINKCHQAIACRQPVAQPGILRQDRPA